MPTVDQLIVQIDASTELLRRELQKGESAVREFGAKTDRHLAGFDAKFQKVGAGIRTAFAAFGVGLSVVGIAAFARSALQTADAIGESARAAGFGAERFQRLAYVFGQNGVSAQEFEGALRTLNTRLGQFIATGAGPAANAIEQLGLKHRITSGQIRTSEQLFDAVADALGGVGNAAQQAALQAALFGREVGSKMAPTMARGAAAINEAAAAASNVFSDEQVAKADALNDAFGRMAQTVGTTLKGALVDATHALARFFGVRESMTDNELQLRITHLKNLVDVLESGGTSRGVARSDIPAIRAEIAALEALEAARKPLDVGGGSARPGGGGQGGRGGDGLEEIRVGNRDLMLRMPNPWRPDTGELQEIRRPAEIRMPADLKSFAPVMRQWEQLKRSAEEYAEATAKATERQQDLAVAIAASFESRGMEALMEGKISDALKGFAKDLAELVLRILVLQPLAEKLAKTLSKIGKGGEGGDSKKNMLAGVLGTVFGGGRAEGGPVSAGRAYMVGEAGRELFVPRASGMIVPSSAIGGVVVQQSFHIQAGLPPQWEAQLTTATQVAAAGAYDATMKRLRGRR